VTLAVNDRPVPFSMKVGEAGEAFFVVETEENVPDELLTSPLIGATEVRTLARDEGPSRARGPAAEPGARAPQPDPTDLTPFSRCPQPGKQQQSTSTAPPDGNRSNPLPSPPVNERPAEAERRLKDEKFGVVPGRPGGPSSSSASQQRAASLEPTVRGPLFSLEIPLKVEGADLRLLCALRPRRTSPTFSTSTRAPPAAAESPRRRP
jgi:hypothetical protein